MKKIGDSFLSELQAKGLAGLPFSWSPSGDFRFMTEQSEMVPNPMTQGQIDAVMQVYAAHDPEAVAPAPPAAPQAVSRYQGREAMRLTPYGNPEDGVSLFDAAVKLLAREDTPPYYVRAWDELQTFDFDSPMLIAVADELGLTREDRVTLFLFAASLKA